MLEESKDHYLDWIIKLEELKKDQQRQKSWEY
jgi:hypothetical protein